MAKSNVTAIRSTAAPLSMSEQSAVSELRRQLEQVEALVVGAITILLRDIPEFDSTVAFHLLDMASDELGERDYITRLEEVCIRHSAAGEN